MQLILKQSLLLLPLLQPLPKEIIPAHAVSERALKATLATVALIRLWRISRLWKQQTLFLLVQAIINFVFLLFLKLSILLAWTRILKQFVFSRLHNVIVCVRRGLNIKIKIRSKIPTVKYYNNFLLNNINVEAL